MAKTLRDWACPSYDTKTGRAASSLNEAGTGSKGNHTTSVGTQIPSISGRNKSGSADSGREKDGGSDLS